MNTIAIDCGASFIKGALLNNGTIVKSCSRQSPVPPSDDIFNTNQIESLVSIVREMVNFFSEGLNEAVLAISNEMHGFILSSEDGSPVIGYISWQREFGSVKIDSKSSIDILSDESLSEDIIHTGMPLRAGLPSTNLLYLIRRNQRDYSGTYFYTLGDYIIRRLSSMQPFCHPTNAAATGLYDVLNGKWNQSMINLICGNSAIIFPVISDCSTIQYSNSKTLITVVPSIGDQQAALLGAGFHDSSDLSFNMGTGAQVSSLVDTPVFSPDGKYQIRPYFNSCYLKTIPHIPSGRAINVFIRFVRDIIHQFDSDIDDDTIWKVILDQPQNKDSDLSTNLSFFENALENNTRGSISNINETNLTMQSLFSSIFKTIAEGAVSLAHPIQNDPVKKIIFSGGIVRRIPAIRTTIMEHYPQTTYIVSKDETLIGLECFSILATSTKENTTTSQQNSIFD